MLQKAHPKATAAFDPLALRRTAGARRPEPAAEAASLAQLRDAESRLVTMFRPGSAAPRAKDVAAVRAEIETLRRAAEEDALGPQMKAEALFKMLSQLKQENASLKARSQCMRQREAETLSGLGYPSALCIPRKSECRPLTRLSVTHQEAMTAEAMEHGALRAQLNGATVPMNGGLTRERDDARAARLAAEALAYEADDIPGALAPEARAALAQTLEEDALFDELIASTAAIDSELRMLLAEADNAFPGLADSELLGPIDALLAQAQEVERAAAAAIAEAAAARAAPPPAMQAPWARLGRPAAPAPPPTPAPAAPSATTPANASSALLSASGRVGAHKAKLEELRLRKSALEHALAGDEGAAATFAALAEEAEAARAEVAYFEAARLDAEKAELDHVIELINTDPELAHSTELAMTLRMDAKRGGIPSASLLPGALPKPLPSGVRAVLRAGEEGAVRAVAEAEAAAAAEQRGSAATSSTAAALGSAAARSEAAAAAARASAEAIRYGRRKAEDAVADAAAVTKRRSDAARAAARAAAEAASADAERKTGSTSGASAAAAASARAAATAAAQAVAAVEAAAERDAAHAAAVAAAEEAADDALSDGEGDYESGAQADVDFTFAADDVAAAPPPYGDVSDDDDDDRRPDPEDVAAATKLSVAKAELQRLQSERSALSGALGAAASLLGVAMPQAATSHDAEAARAASAVERGASERRRMAAAKAAAEAAALSYERRERAAAAEAVRRAAERKAEVTRKIEEARAAVDSRETARQAAAAEAEAVRRTAAAEAREAAAAAAAAERQAAQARAAEQRAAAQAAIRAAAERRAADSKAAADRRRADDARAAEARAAESRAAEARAAAEAEAWILEQRRAGEARAAADAEAKAAQAARAAEERAVAARVAAEERAAAQARAAAEAQVDKERRAAQAKASAERAAERARAAAERAAADAAAAAARDTSAAERAAEMAADSAMRQYADAIAAEWVGVTELADAAAGFSPRDEDEAEFWEAQLKAAEGPASAMSRLLAANLPVSEAGVWFTDPSPPVPGLSMTLYYSPETRPLRGKPDILLHAGFNGWESQAEIIEPMAAIAVDDLPAGAPAGNSRVWFERELDVPITASCVDFVASDGRNAWDNNNSKDYHVLVADADARGAAIRAARAMEALVTWREERQAAVVADAQRRQLRERAAQEAAAESQRVIARQMARVMYTSPARVVAGQRITIHYNPATAGVLRGASEVWVRGGFNRWRGDPRRWGPIRLQRASGGGAADFMVAELDVPLDIWSIDFVFSDNGNATGGTYDNRETLDYHVPVAGGIKDGQPAQETPLHVVSISVEMAPIAKVGGLGDVVTSLGRAVLENGHRCEVIMPKYDVLDYTQIANIREDGGFNWGKTFTKIFRGEVEGVPTVFLEPANGYFWSGCIYGADFKGMNMTDAERFYFFSMAALEYLVHTKQSPDVIHIHDWQTAPVAKALWSNYHANGLPNTRVVFTIHNMNYGANLIAEAVAYSQRATTVSKTYAEEISGHPAIKPHLTKFRGIVNGIDPDIWDPMNDALLPAYFDVASCAAGKDAAKKALRQRLGLAERDVPVVGVVTRLTGQKGISQIKHGLFRALERGGQAVLLGSAPDPAVQRDFEKLAEELRKKYPQDAALVFKFDEPLSHLIYAGADMLLVPSVFEPCGLSQLIAMRYGTVPVVRRTGGLADTVFDVDNDRERAAAAGVQPNGFNFEGTDAGAMDYGLNRAVDLFYNKRSDFRQLQATCMAQDWSWNRPATDYVEIYHAAARSGS